MTVRIGQHKTRLRRTFFKEWREFRGLTQEQLAERMGTTKSAVSKVERGENRYNQSNLEAWSDALDCEPSDLISRSPKDDDLSILYKRAAPDIQELIQRVLKHQ